jgi:HEAT repeat protein
LKSLRSLGRASDIAVLLNAAASGGTGRQAVARESLDLVPGKEVDEALMSALNEADARMRFEVIRSLGARSVYAAFESVITAGSQEGDPVVRLQAFKALSRLAQERDLSRLMELLKRTRNPEEQEAAEAAILAVCEKSRNESARSGPLLAALAAESSPAVRSSLLRILGGVGGDAALVAVQAALKEEAIRDSAIRVLAAWPDPRPIEDLAQLARSSTDSTQQALCLRGFIRMIALQKECSPEKRLELYEQAVGLARRPDEKKLALAGMAQMGETKVLQALDRYLEDPELQPDAAAATLKVAFATRHKSKEDSLAAINKVLKLTTSESLRAEALKDKEGIDLP